MSKYLFTAVFGLIIATSAGLAAQTGAIRRVPPPTAGLRFAEPWRPANAKGDTRIIGTVIDIRQIPVGGVKVQLRDLSNGEITQETVANENGQYEFSVENPGTYVVEMVLVDGYIVALSNAGSLARYETLQTVIQLPGRWDAVARNVILPQNIGRFVGLSAQTSMTAATMTMAAEQAVTPVDAGEPVSP
jgi:hypothetical protein